MLNKEQLEEERRLMYVGMTRGKMELHMLYARTRMLWGQTQSNEPSRFIYDIPDSLIERRSDNVLSAFAWASDSGFKKAKQGKDIEPFRQKAHIDAEFNQDMDFDDDINQDSEAELAAGMRIRHPSFGLGIIKSIRGDIAEIQFDSGESKTLALSIAPIERV
jgi:DNA helicase-2/ATP-dependent DNA helicase PcrA